MASDKIPGPGETRPLLRETRPRRRATTAMLGALALLATYTVTHSFQHASRGDAGPYRAQDGGDGGETPWSWASVTPSRDLNWETCYNATLECARLDVPMDWLDPTDEDRVILGVIKKPAQSTENPLPPVFVNPGGPGGSGVSFVEEVGAKIQAVIGYNQDIISFDPRGVGVSTPRMECWGNSQKREMWALQNTPVVDERPGLAYDDYARKVAYSAVCEDAMEPSGIMRHLSSASIARDMLEILDKTGHSRLRYWGFSYGTILGGVFAGLFPDRVERLVSDGNVDYGSWFQANHIRFVQDADKILDAFDSKCHEAGPDRCALWDQSPSAVQARRAGVLSSQKKQPVVVPPREGGPVMPQLVTYSALQLLTRALVYAPQAHAGEMAAAYAALEAGDGRPFHELRARTEAPAAPGRFCAVGDIDAAVPLPTGVEPDAFPAIMCSDAAPVADSPDEYAAYAERIGQVSRWTGAASTSFRSACLGRTVRPKWRFSDEDFRGDTAYPILFAGNTADNVTPLESARNNSARFPSSVLLTQNSYGHCTLAAASTCTARHIRAYFQDGSLPGPGTTCEPDYDLFERPSAEEVRQLGEFGAAVHALSEKADFGWMGGLFL